MPFSHKGVRCYQKLHPDSVFKFWEGAGWRRRGLGHHYVAKAGSEGFEFLAVLLPRPQ